MDTKQIVAKIKTLDTKDKVKFILLFGSVAKGKAHIHSDIDIALYYQGSKEERLRFQIKVLGELPKKIDVSILQDLPLAVQREAISGKLLYCGDANVLSEEFVRVVRAYRYFEPHLKTYFETLEAVTLGS